MTRYRVAIEIVPRRGLLDPQGKAVSQALHALGFAAVADVRVGRHLIVDTEADSPDDAGSEAQRMCEQLLANPVTEDFQITSVEVA